jgi:simple sugar transport system permease protein
MLRLEPRKELSRTMFYVAPVMALAMTIIAGAALFLLIGKDPVAGLTKIFIEPLTTYRGIAELTVKATPLILIAVGLALGFRANVWNIGAEGQYTIGALTGGSVALAAYPGGGYWVLPLMCVAGALGGAAWAAIPALLKTRFNANEILVSLMLTYVAILLLSYLVHGPLRDPEGLNFPQSRLFQKPASMPVLLPHTRAHWGFVAAIAAALVAQLVLARHVIGYQIRVIGAAPNAAKFAGFSESRIIWMCLLISGALAGLSGLFEAAGPVGQIVEQLPNNYGFTAIIVAFLGRLSPIGIILSGFLMALTYNGGDAAQVALSMPAAVKSVFQGMLLFFLLAVDVLVTYRIRLTRSQPATAPAPASAAASP